MGLYSELLGTGLQSFIKKDAFITAKNSPCSPDKSESRLPFGLYAALQYHIDKKCSTSVPSLNCYQCIFTTAGTGYIQSGEKLYHCTENSVFLLDGQTSYILWVGEKQHWEYQHLYFFASSGANAIVEKALGYANMDRSYRNLRVYFSDIFNECKHWNDNSQFIISNTLSCIMTEMIIRPVVKEKTQYSRKALLEQTTQFFKKNYHQKISIKEYAQQNYISVYYFIRLFKEEYGVSPYAYLENIRIEKAKQLLLEQNLSIEQIVIKCGLGNTNNFLRIFKNRFGSTPSEFRTKQKQLSVYDDAS